MTAVGDIYWRCENGLRRPLLWSGVTLVFTLCGACTSVQVRYPDGTTAWQSRAEFEVYVERVFRFHNRLLNDLIVATILMDGDELHADAPLVRAEESMARACQPLNDTVSATFEGREIGFFQKLQLPAAVPACEAATRTMEALLMPR
jgi:hypothetical protein